MNECANYTFESMLQHYRYLLDDIAEWSETAPFELTIKLKSGRTVAYDDLTKTIRTLPKDSNNMTDEEIKIEFGKRLQKMMYIRGVTQTELSEQSGIPQPMISSYMTGRTMPSFAKVDKIARVLKCSVDDLRYLD